MVRRMQRIPPEKVWERCIGKQCIARSGDMFGFGGYVAEPLVATYDDMSHIPIFLCRTALTSGLYRSHPALPPANINPQAFTRKRLLEVEHQTHPPAVVSVMFYIV